MTARHARMVSEERDIVSDTRDAHISETPSAAETTWDLVDFDRYVVTDGGPVGYVDVVPPLFVCYLGHPYAKAEEIAQVHEFQQAVRIIVERTASSRRPEPAS